MSFCQWAVKIKLNSLVYLEDDFTKPFLHLWHVMKWKRKIYEKLFQYTHLSLNFHLKPVLLCDHYLPQVLETFLKLFSKVSWQLLMMCHKSVYTVIVKGFKNLQDNFKIKVFCKLSDIQVSNNMSSYFPNYISKIQIQYNKIVKPKSFKSLLFHFCLLLKSAVTKQNFTPSISIFIAENFSSFT